MKATDTFHIPTRPYSAIDLCNRRAAATGSMRYAQLTAEADYNGHLVGVTYNTYRGYWIAEYFWGGRRVLARGSLGSALRAARAEYDRGAVGASVYATYPREAAADERMPEESKQQFAAACRDAGFVAGKEPNEMPWWTPKHDAVCEAMRFQQRFPELVGIACNLPDDCTKADWDDAARAR